MFESMLPPIPLLDAPGRSSVAASVPPASRSLGQHREVPRLADSVYGGRMKISIYTGADGKSPFEDVAVAVSDDGHLPHVEARPGAA
jgi:hypothetical protein